MSAYRLHTRRAVACVRRVVVFVTPLVVLGFALASLHERPGQTNSVDPASIRPDPALLRVASLPIPAQGAISARLGRDRQAYHAVRTDRGYSARNPHHDLSIDFDYSGVAVASGVSTLRMRLLSIGYGEHLHLAAPARIHVEANRVEYHGTTLTEWYSNGPLGLQQGFNVAAPPGNSSGEPLTLLLELGGNLQAMIEAGNRDVALRSPDRRVALRYRGLTALDAAGVSLPAWLSLEGQRLRIRVDDRKARYPIVIDPFIEDAKLTASDGLASDRFGAAVAVSGATIVVGANFDDVGANNSQGSAYVFVRPPGGWTNAVQSAHLFASDGGVSDQFGESVAISGNTVVVGAHTAGASSIGAAYVFVKPATGWSGNLTESARLVAANAPVSLQLGGAVAISGDTVVAGAPSFSGARGAAYVFTAPGGIWTGTVNESARLSASDAAVNDNFGGAVAVDGNTIVVGAQLDDILAAGDDEGSAYVFVKPAAGWSGLLSQNAKLTASDGATTGAVDDNFANAVDVSGDTVVVGAAFDNVGANANQGSVYVFVKPAAGWAGLLTETAHLTGSTAAAPGGANDQFGTSVAISGGTVAVGALLGPGTSNPNYGSVTVYNKPAGGWVTTSTFNQKLVPADVSGTNNQFANAVDIDGSTIIAGRPIDSSVASQRGSAYVFTSDTGIQLSSLTLNSGSVAGCKSVTGTVTLAGPAPTGGISVSLSDTLLRAQPPNAVIVPAGSTTKTFTIKTFPVSSLQIGVVTASLGAVSKSAALTLRPIGPSSVSLVPLTQVGGLSVAGKATLECNAAPGPIDVQLASDQAAVASPVAATITVPQGLRSAAFTVATNKVLTKTSAKISATGNGITKSKALTVTPAASVSPASLNFGNVKVSTTSGTLTATLTNKGAQAFSVNSITLTGTYAARFVLQSNGCPPTLAAGASCAIGVAFKPLAAVSRSAKLTIATSATAVPLSVSLSGAGIL